MEASTRNLQRFRTVLLLSPFLVISVFAALDRGFSAEETTRVSAVCLDCHDGYDSGLADTPHRVGDDMDTDASLACTDCHAGDARHYEDDPEAFPMTNPAKVNAEAAANTCSSCHMNSHQQNMLEKNVHSENEINCAGCHSVHGSVGNGLLKASQPELCLSCHTTVEGQFARPYRHPVNDGIVQCSECHQTLDETSKELALNGTNACMECHVEFEGPFPFEHQATVDYSTEEGACLNCHDPHGSFHPRLLKQPYEPPHFQLCSQCHSVPRHQFNTQHGDRFAGSSCNDCHSDIHGSYTNHLFLNETLQGEGCFNSGCHDL